MRNKIQNIHWQMLTSIVYFAPPSHDKAVASSISGCLCVSVHCDHEQILMSVVSHVCSRFIFPERQIRCSSDACVCGENQLLAFVGNSVSNRVWMSCLYMLPYICMIVSSLCGSNYILTSKVNLCLELVWRLGTPKPRRCCLTDSHIREGPPPVS